MRQHCIDVFKAYNLPFRTYLNTCVNHPDEVHDELEFIWLFKGTVHITCEDKHYTLTPSHVFVIYIAKKHSMKATGPTTSISFRLKKTHLQRLNLFFEAFPFENPLFTIDELILKYPQVPFIMLQLLILMQSPESTLNNYYSLVGYYNMYVYDLYASRLKERYLDIKKKNYDSYLIRFHAINEYLHKNYHQKITLGTLAGVVNISPSRLSHFIKEILGISFQHYLNEIRLEKALVLLKNTDLPIHSICKQCGFSDQKYLNNLLKDKFHLTALKYRKIMKGNVYSLTDLY